MKIDRQIGILSLLLQRERMTTAELAKRFEVSRRTILRDIEDINRAGIPIVSTQGPRGGISIMENYKLDRTVLSSHEMQAILSGLHSLDSVSGSSRYRRLMEKLSAHNSDMVNVDQHIIIDLSLWDKETVADKIELISAAMDRKEQIAFTYYAPSGETRRIMEPYHLIFQWTGWYVWGYCTRRQDYRMFKLTRLTELTTTGVRCESRQVPEYSCDKLRHTKGEIAAEVRFDAAVKWRVVDEWGAGRFEEDADGNITAHITWSDAPSLFHWLLTFGDHAEIVAPWPLREEFIHTIRRIQGKYDI